MDIVIIGSGNVAAVLGRKFKAAGHQILQVYGRNTTAASALAYEFDAESTNYTTTINRQAQVYLIAVADDAIADIVSDLRLPGKVVAHTAASVPKEILKEVSAHYGVFYPLQSLRKEVTTLPDIPVFFDGSDEVATATLEKLAYSIANVKVVQASDDDRLKLHVAGVIVNNFTNHLYELAEDYCRKEGLDFKQLLPIIEETALRLRNVSPRAAQTGPALRHDRETIEKHIALLEKYPQLKHIYILMTESIQQVR